MGTNAQRSTPSTSSSAKERIVQVISGLNGLASVEELIKSKLSSDADLLQQIPRYLLNLGGKRIRPILCLLTARALGQKEHLSSLVDVAAGIELIHMATLLHDDIIDRSPLRRHEESPYLKFGLGNTLLSGDFLLVRAFSLCARLDSFIIDETEKACIELTEGEILETPLSTNHHTIESSLTISRKKTASLFRLAALSAAHLTSQSAATVQSFATFGEKLGCAFQVLDDVLDVTSSEDLLGKKAGIDIRERKPSVVNVLWLSSDSALAKEALLSSSELSDAFIAKCLAELRNSEVVGHATALALSLADEARKALHTGLAGSAMTDQHSAAGLESIIDYCVERME